MDKTRFSGPKALTVACPECGDQKDLMVESGTRIGATVGWTCAEGHELWIRFGEHGTEVLTNDPHHR